MSAISEENSRWRLLYIKSISYQVNWDKLKEKIWIASILGKPCKIPVEQLVAQTIMLFVVYPPPKLMKKPTRANKVTYMVELVQIATHQVCCYKSSGSQYWINTATSNFNPGEQFMLVSGIQRPQTLGTLLETRHKLYTPHFHNLHIYQHIHLVEWRVKSLDMEQ